MPTYEYACANCGHRFEEFQRISAEPIRECPKCSGRLERVINGGVGLIFRGTGFYLTDYKKTNTSAGSNGGSGKSEKAESKPEAKQESTTTEKAA